MPRRAQPASIGQIVQWTGCASAPRSAFSSSRCRPSSVRAWLSSRSPRRLGVAPVAASPTRLLAASLLRPGRCHLGHHSSSTLTLSAELGSRPTSMPSLLSTDPCPNPASRAPPNHPEPYICPTFGGCAAPERRRRGGDRRLGERSARRAASVAQPSASVRPACCAGQRWNVLRRQPPANRGPRSCVSRSCTTLPRTRIWTEPAVFGRGRSRGLC